MDFNSPDIDIVIVNYNGMKYLEACLDSIEETEYPSFRVMLVDNNSTDGSVEFVGRKYPDVQVITSGENFGFGKANTTGIKAGTAEFIALLNSDTVVDKNWLSPLVREMLEDNSTASVCSKLLFMDNPRVINGVGGGMNFLGYGFDYGIYEIDDGSLDRTTEVFFPCAAACLIRRSAFFDVGGFDEKFFMYHEDVDLGWRFWLKGYRVKCVPQSVVYHVFGGTSSKSGSMDFRNTLGLRHAIRSLMKNYELGTLLKVLPLVFSLGVRTTVKHKNLQFLKCAAWNLRMLPDTLRERRRIQKTRTVKDCELSRLIWQKIHLPVNYPGYKFTTMRSFAAEGHRRDFIDLSDNRPKDLGYGWHSTEVYFGDGKTRYRWTKSEAALYLWNKSGEGTILFEVLGLAGLLKQPRKISISVNGSPPEDFLINSDNWESLTIPVKCETGPLEIVVRTSDTWVPDELFGNGDLRRLGVGVKRVRFVSGKKTVIDGISVIIPTYNRIQILLRTLRALEMQNLEKDKFEVIVVDDGSADTTEAELRAFSAQTSINFKYLRQTNKKQGAARNLGLKHSAMSLIIFLGDDIIPTPTFLRQHLDYHREKNYSGNMVVIGLTSWPEDIRVTPFMKFIGEYGYQFGYSLIEGEGPLPFNFFYTSNISILKAFLDELECIFEEDFTTYGWEDIELGYRLEALGMELMFNKNAVAYHFHPVNVSGFCARQLNVGRASRVFLKKHPELGWFLGDLPQLRKLAAFSFLTSVLGKALNFFDQKFSISFPRILYDIVLKTSYAKGVITSGD